VSKNNDPWNDRRVYSLKIRQTDIFFSSIIEFVTYFITKSEYRSKVLKNISEISKTQD